MGRTSGRITFSLKDRGYKHNGIPRNIDIAAAVQLINSDKMQELITNKTRFGYYGHQWRELFGLEVPETGMIDGKEIKIEPAVVTIYLNIDNEGNLTHEQEFIDNPSGEHAYRQYKAKIGGFSSAFFSPVLNGVNTPQMYHGMDYVLRPNFNGNRAQHEMMDSMDGATDLYQRAYLEQSIVEMMDSMAQCNFAYAVAGSNADRAVTAEEKLQRELKLKARRLERAKEIEQNELLQEQDLQASILLDSMPFDEVLKLQNQFRDMKVISTDDEKEAKKTSTAEKVVNALSKFF